MNIKQTIKVYSIAIGILFGVIAINAPLQVGAISCGGVTTSIISCDEKGGGTCIQNGKTITVEKDQTCPDGTQPKVAIEATGFWGILLMTINILTAGIGIVAVAGIVYGSILYASAGGSPDQVKKARDIIRNVVIGILAYALMYSALNFIVPGGIFN